MNMLNKLVLCGVLLCLIGSDLRSAPEVADNDPLFQAVEKQDVSAVRQLIAEGTDVHVRYLFSCEDKMTILMQAAKIGNVEVVKALLDAGADVNAADSFQATPLTYAAQAGRTEIITLLLDHGAEVNPFGREGCGVSPLMCAANDGYEQAVQLLLSRGAEFNTADFEGWTALFFAVRNNYPTIVQMLLEAGANPNVMDGYGNTPLAWAKACNYTACAQLLVAHGAKKGNFFSRMFRPIKRLFAILLSFR